MRKIIAILLLFLALTLISCGKENSDFIIKDGVLTEYKGTDTVVVIPNKVKEIADFVFSKSPACDEITEITLGKNVENISPKAFFGLDGLVKINVPEENVNFTFEESILHSNSDTDSLQFFVFTGERVFDFYEFYEKHLDENPEKFGRDKSGYLTLGSAVFGIELFGTREDGGLKINTADVYGHSIETLTREPGGTVRPVFCGPNSDIHVLLADNVAILTDLTSGQARNTWCFTEEGVYEMYDLLCDSVVLFSLCEDGSLEFEHWASKYYRPTWVYHLLEQCVSRDEFCFERGKVVFVGGKPIYTTEETQTVSEKYDLDEAFFTWHGFDDTYATLDEMISDNAKKYQAYDPDSIKN